MLATYMRRKGNNNLKIGIAGSSCHPQLLDHFTFLGNCPPTPPLSQHFALSKNQDSVNVGLGKG